MQANSVDVLPMMNSDETIVAISTPRGPGGIGIIRISGYEALGIALKIFIFQNPPDKIDERKLYFGRLLNRGGKFLDHGYLAYFKAPVSYTGEDVVELSCHGSPFVLQMLLEEIVQSGAHAAAPGEFTMRAFLNGKVDLIQAEAIRDLIEAQTSYQARIAYDQLEGDFSRRLGPLKEKLVDAIANIEGTLDFPDEEEKFSSAQGMEEDFNSISLNIKELIDSFQEGQIIREGATIAIVGAPNVGKSSVFNQLLRYDRAIVTEVPGTTRDTVEESIDIQGIPARLIDTAGLREAADIVEREGVKRSKNAMQRADIILYIIDLSRDMSNEELEFLEKVQALRAIIVKNKKDLIHKMDEKDINNRFPHTISVSAKTGEGISELNDLIRNTISSVREDSLSDCIVTNVRHAELLRKALRSMDRASFSLKNALSEEYVSIDLKKALQAINELTGETTLEDIYDRIFSKFCVGK